MDENIKSLIEDYVDCTNEYAALCAKVDVLHEYVNKRDRDFAQSGAGLINCEDIRVIFGWLPCKEAEEMKLEKKFVQNL